VVGAFSRASDAIAAALDAQRALNGESWPVGADLRVRMAIHTGEAQLRDEGNYLGQTVNRCARLRAIGHGGQVLLSDTTAGLAADRLPAGASLIELGVHRLKDLSRPERVWQLSHRDLETSFPPLRSVDAFRNNLPAQLTPLIGRDGDVPAVGTIVRAERLVTLTGSGGIGKTRLALAVAADQIETYPGGVWLAELAGVNDPAAVAATVLAATGALQSVSESVVAAVARELSDGSFLIVLDNCEHLIPACAAFANDLLAASGSATVLATSREPLGVQGEVVWRVPSLEAPTVEDGPVPVRALSQYDAVQLFADRARRARPSFSVSDATAPAVAQICYRLDGIPLALELAAARCRQISVERIAHDLDDRFRLLTGGARTVLPRQQTLEASIDWSHDRLDPIEQVVFRRLGIFTGTFPLEAAEGVVTAPGDVESVEVFDLLCRLVDKSLVQVTDAGDGEPRYRMLESLRAYAVSRAREAGEIVVLRTHHARWWCAWLEERWADLHTDAMVELVDEFHADLRSALDGSVDDPQLGLDLLWRLGRPWQNSSRYADAMAGVDRFMTDDNAARFPEEWMRAATTVATLVVTARGYVDMISLLKVAERIASERGDEYYLTVVRWLSGFTPELCVSLRTLAHQNGQRYAEALSILALAQLEVDGDPRAGLALLTTPEAIAAAGESSYLADTSKRVQAMGDFATGRLSRCIDSARELTTTRSLLFAVSAIQLLIGAGLLSGDEDTLAFAVDFAERKLRGTPHTASTADMASAAIDLVRGGPSRLAKELRPDNTGLVTLQLYIHSRGAIDAGETDIALATVSAVARPHPHGRAVAAAIEAAISRDEDQWHAALRLAVDHDLRLIVVDAIEGLAVAASSAESWTECLRLAAAADQLRRETGYAWRYPTEQEVLAEAVASAQQHLGPERATAAETEGHRLDWHEVAAYVQRARGERKRPRHGWASLTPTESQIVALVAEGLTNPQIADRLLMGRATVKTHLEHIFAKIGVSTRAELAAKAAQQDGYPQ
jgi:predicted ATPase/DNA-binding CsgD family transcriptional regulator